MASDRVETILEAKDKVSSVLDSIGGRAGQVADALNRVVGVVKQLSAVGDSLGALAPVLGAIAGVALSAFLQIKALQWAFSLLDRAVLGALNALRPLLGVVKAFALEGILANVRLQSFTIGVEQLAKATGRSTSSALATVRALADVGRIARIEAAQMYALGISAGLSEDQLMKLAAAARDLSRVASESTTQTFSRFVEAIGSSNMELLRAVGITKNLDEMMREYAAAHKMKTTAIDSATRAQIIFNAILERSGLFLGAYDKAQKTTAGQLMSFPRYWKNFQESALGAGERGLFPVIKWINQFLMGLDTLNRAGWGVASVFQRIGDAVSGALAAFGGPGQAAQTFADWIERTFSRGNIARIIAFLSAWGQLKLLSMIPQMIKYDLGWKLAGGAKTGLPKPSDLWMQAFEGLRTATKGALGALKKTETGVPETGAPLSEGTGGGLLKKIGDNTKATAENTQSQLEAIFGGGGRLKTMAAAATMGARGSLRVTIDVKNAHGPLGAFAAQVAQSTSAQIMGQLSSRLATQIG